LQQWRDELTRSSWYLSGARDTVIHCKEGKKEKKLRGVRALKYIWNSFSVLVGWRRHRGVVLCCRDCSKSGVYTGLA